MSVPKSEDVKRGIAVIWENLQCPICLDLMSKPVSTRCDHQFCKFCMMKLLERNKRKDTSCPVCKTKVTKRSLQESPGFQKLVEGLQTLVQSYEFDTGTNYFTGMPHGRRGASVGTESRDQQCSEESTVSEDNVMDKSASLSSSTAAKDAFAKLMDLEDSHPANSQQDCFDPGPGDLPQASENKLADVEDVPPTTGLNGLPAQHQGSPDDVAPKSRKRSSRKSKRRGLEPDRIVDKRKKKSVEKVSEWLMKISPSSDNVEGDGPLSSDSEAEESVGSTASTEVITKDDKVIISPVREVHGRPLEEQVFGAVYKRDRKAGMSNRKVFSPEREVVPALHPAASSKNDEQTKRRLSKRNSGRKMTPADCVKKSSDQETRVQDQEDADKPKESSDVEEGSKLSGGNEEVMETCPLNEEKSDHDAGTMDESPAFDVPVKRPGRRSKVKMQDAWQDMDHDLAAKETSARKRRLTRSNSEGLKDQVKECKYAKSLALVSAGTDMISRNPKLVETEVTIESYPSSPDPKSSDARKTRRSSRLQEFTAEVQDPLKSKRRRSKLALPKPTEGSENDPSGGLNQPEKIDNGGASNDGQSDKAERIFRTNGCVFTDDLETIEAVQPTEETPVVPCVSDGNEENALVSVVPDTGDQEGPCTPRSNVVLNTPSSSVAAIPDSSLPERRQESPSIAVVAPDPLIAAGERRGAEDECDVNDSELDTEQLMKTFKATKRKSFCLGSPRKSLQNLEEHEHESKDQTEHEDGNSDQSSGLLPLNPGNQPLYERSSKPSQTCLETNVSSVSLLQSESPPPSKRSQQDYFLKASGTSESSALSPNKVARSTQGSQLLPNEPEGSCLLFSTSITQDCSNKSPESLKGLLRITQVLKEDQRNGSIPKIDSVPNKILDTPVGNSGVHSNNFESSVTPDGLVPNDVYQIVEPVADRGSDRVEDAGGGEILSQPCLPRKRRAQRLESSDSESSLENDSLPSMAQIFKSNRLSARPREGPPSESNEDGPQVEGQNPGSEPLSRQLGQCVEPKNQESLENVESATKHDQDLPNPGCRDEWITSSQGSVDLFGTPEECEEAVDGVCVHAGLSIDSQYSSEIINTQQKEEMQQELRRLERMMALVSEALQKKESGETGDKNETEDSDKHPAGKQQQQCRTTSPRSCQSEVSPQNLEVKDHEVAPEGEKTTDTRAETTLVNECGSDSAGKMELVASGLSPRELGMVRKFAKKMQGSTSRHVTPSSTHIIIKTDAHLVCERTLKYFQGIAGRKWMVSFLWISECFKQGKVLDESLFEVCGDVVNGHDHNGPRRARTTPDKDLLMKGYEICFQGSFTDMTSDQMEVLVEMCGATVMKDPLMFSKQANPYQLVVVQPGPDDSQSYYTALQKKARVVTRSWLLDSIATYTLQNPDDYKP
ncbi:breast cancer type 1 susceptibility protein homolog [Trichomycterus rosablanca]|uniref:breast cancer type 1 susceptibility protein homolog n=1 Tax=Trichomycterus rosablanca TaxID=2290929 RepID=UPI002F357EDF